MSTEGSSDEVYVRAASFLTGLFKRATIEVSKITSEGTTEISDISTEFRERMTKGQIIKFCNMFREDFYRYVIRYAKDVSLVLNLAVVYLVKSSSRVKNPLGIFR